MSSAAIIAVVFSLGLTSGQAQPTASIERQFLIFPPDKVSGWPLLYVPLPDLVPFVKDSKEAQNYLRGYIEGFTDWFRPRFCCRSNAEFRNTLEYREGIQAGYAAGRMMKPRKPGR